MDFLNDPQFIPRFIMVISALVLGITVHEWAHAFVADRLGDRTPRSQGRVNLWPLSHLDPIGSICMVLSTLVGFGIGWGRPVETDPRQYTINWRLGHSLVAVAGPLSNLAIAIVFAAIYRSGVIPPGDIFNVWCYQIIRINVILLLFNLLPFFPLDGSHLVANLLPERLGERYRQFNQQYGLFIFLAVLVTQAHSLVLLPAVAAMIQLLLGPP